MLVVDPGAPWAEHQQQPSELWPWWLSKTSHATTAHLFPATWGTPGTISVVSAASMLSILICVDKVHLLELVLALTLHEVLHLAHARVSALGACRRRAIPRWMRDDLPLPLSVSGQRGASVSPHGGSGQPHSPAAGRCEGSISSEAELCDQPVRRIRVHPGGRGFAARSFIRVQHRDERGPSAASTSVEWCALMLSLR